jgi:hypothetical protein
MQKTELSQEGISFEMRFFQWASSELRNKKPELPSGKARLEVFTEGLCVQMMHIGPYASESESVAKMEDFMVSQGLKDMVGQGSKHHEIYLSDPRKTKPEKMKTVLRHSVARM